LSLSEAADSINESPAWVERAVEEGLAIPASAQKPYRFSVAEVHGWTNDIGELSRQRVQRNADGTCAGLSFEPGQYASRHRFILPFVGCWLVTAGGHSKTAKGRFHNAHCSGAPCERWGCDFGVINSDDHHKCRPGMSRRELLALRFRRGQAENTPDCAISEPDEEQPWRRVLNPSSCDNRSCYLYGVAIVAPADGVVMTCRGAKEDPEFGERVRDLSARGADDEMHLLIDHGQGEISALGHVLGRSIQVRPGQQVRRGQLLCKAGARSGFMSHLHWAVADGWHPLFAHGLPILISECLVHNGNTFEKRQNVWLEQGMLVQNP